MKTLYSILTCLGMTLSVMAQETSYLSKEEIIDLYVNLYKYSETSEIPWNGDVNTCACGHLSEDILTAAEIRVNFFRLTNRLNTVHINPAFNAEAQQAALLSKANNELNHYPTSSMKCYSQAAYNGCNKSCLSFSDFTNFPETSFITGFIQDYGESNYEVGHRRWILYTKLQEIGYGATDETEALLTTDGTTYDAVEAPEFIAYPWSGYVPVELIFPKWSFTIPEDHEVNFDQVKVSMKDASGRPIAIELYEEHKDFLDPTIVWCAKGLFTEYEITYGQNHLKENGYLDQKIMVKIENVVIDGQKKNFQYFVEPFELDGF